MITKNSIGIDIQEDMIALVWLQSNLWKTRLAGSKVFPVPEGKNRADKLVRAGNAVDRYITGHRISSPEMYLAFPGEKAVVRTLTFPLSIKENFRETIRYELEKYVPFSEDQVHHDSHIITEDRKKKELTILLTVVKKEDFTPYLRMCEHLGNGVSGIEGVYSALINGLGGLPESRSYTTFVYLHKAGSRYFLSFVHNNTLLSGRSLNVETGAGLADLLSPEIKMGRKGLIKDGPLPVLIARGTEIPTDWRKSGPDFSIIETGLEGFIPSAGFIPAYGLALKGLKKVPMQVNLMPRALRKRPDRKALYLIYVLFVVSFVLAITWPGGLLVKKRAVQKNLEQRIEQLKEEVRGTGSLEKEVADRREKIEFLNRFQKDHPAVLAILNELTGIVPPTAWINTFRLTDGKVEIKGVAESASDLLPLLEASPVFDEAAFTSTINKTKQGKEEFQIKLRIEN